MSAWLWTSDGPRPLAELLAILAAARAAGQRIVSTNGCFDLLHLGHAQFLAAARAQGDLLVVGLNSDESVRRLKGAGRPLVPQNDRAALLLALRSVDYVVIFDHLTPNALLAQLRPDVHCKAGDYTLETLPEAQIVQRNGGEVRLLPLTVGYSTSRVVERVLASSGGVTPSSAAPSDAIERGLNTANALRQTVYALRDQLTPATHLLAAASRIWAVDDDAAALLRAAGFARAATWSAAVGPGDALVLLDSSDAARGTARAARSAGIAVIALLGSETSLDDATLGLALPVAGALLRPTQFAVLALLAQHG